MLRMLCIMTLLPIYLLAGFELPSLDFDTGDLAPHISKQIMQLHHDKHHRGYVQGLNDTMSQPGLQQYRKWSLTDLLLYVDTLPRYSQEDVRFYAGGHANHAFFWRTLCSPKHSRQPQGALRKAIENNFGSFEIFQETFTRVARRVRGSGWAWLVLKGDGVMSVVGTHNHDSPLSQGNIPILVLDVWEHAYYLKYHNNRGDYITNWWSIVNWDFVERLYTAFAVDNEPITRWFDVVQNLSYITNMSAEKNTSHKHARGSHNSRRIAQKAKYV